MKKFLFDFVITLPVATILYFILILFGGIGFELRWLAIAIALDLFDWMVAEITT